MYPKTVHNHKKRKDSLENRAVLLISLELERSEVALQRIHQNSKKWWLLWGIAQWKWLTLATFCCYDYGTNAFEVVQKIATDQEDFHKCSSCLIVCWIAKIYQSITVKKVWLLTYKDTSGVAKKAVDVAHKKE